MDVPFVRQEISLVSHGSFLEGSTGKKASDV